MTEPAEEEDDDQAEFEERSSAYCREMLAGLITTPFEGDMVEWADGTLKIPYSVRYPIFLAGESPWLLGPMRAISDPKVKRVDVRMPAGAAKSLIGEVMIAYTISEDPGMLYYVWQTDDDAKDAMEDRISPMIEANDFLSVKLPVDRNKKRAVKIAFPHMSLYAVGANLSAAQSKRVKRLIMEEPHLYGPGMMTAFEKRVEGVDDYKIVTLSTGSVIGDESDESFNSGSVERWQVPCPHCGTFQAMNDGKDRLKADINEETCDDQGEYDWNKILPTVRYNCEQCGQDWPTDNEFRRMQAKQGKYVATNPNAPENHRSFHMAAPSVHYFPLSKILMEKLKASFSARRGALEPLKDYVQKRNADAWDESPVDSDTDAAFERSKGEYLMGEPFDGEIARFLTIDNQAGRASKGQGAHRWLVCRAFGPMECRTIWAGRLTSWEECEEKRIELGVEPARTLVDMAYDAPAVQEICVRYGWQGLWGDNTSKRSFPHHETILINGQPQRITRKLPYSPPNLGHAGFGKAGVKRQARYFFWCQNPIKDMWHRLKGGMSTYRWTVAQDIPDEYKKHCSVEFKKLVVVKKTGRKEWVYFTPDKKDDHLGDCDQMCLVAGIMDPRIRELLWSSQDEEPEPESAE